MNRSQKKTFISFVALYILSSLTLLSIIFTFYYKNEMSNDISIREYKMRNFAMNINSMLIDVQMHGSSFELPNNDMYGVGMFDVQRQEIYTKSAITKWFEEKEFLQEEDALYYIDFGARMHHKVKYIVLVDRGIDKSQSVIFERIVFGFILASLFIMIIGYFLSLIMLRPISNSMAMMEKFIKDTTHELNTPVTSLMMSVNRLLKLGTYDEKVVKRVLISTKNINQTYNSLSYMSFDKVEDREDRELELCDVIDKSRSYFSEIQESKHIRLQYNCVPCSVMMDEEMLSRVLNNILSNSIKYTHPHKMITITQEECKLRIKDEGIGIDQKFMNDIFNRYTRATDFTGGFGLGLSIVKSICDEYGINIEVQSEEGKGTIFTLDFDSVSVK